MRKAFLFSSLAALLGGCGHSVKGYRFENVSLPPREGNCPVEIFTTPPKGRSRELGVVEFKKRGKLGKLPRTADEALLEAHPFACMAGGNGLVVVRDRDGLYSKATIVRVKK